jgi:GDP-4-dehydro-6-deoxy-D-mannose reductase
VQRAVVTGAQGFIGRHLVRELRRHGVEVTPFVRRVGIDATELVLGEALWSATRLARLITALEPDVVFHLAGRTRGTPAELEESNVGVTRQMLEALRPFRDPPLLVVCGSAAEYGEAVVDGVPVEEDADCVPQSEYGAIKLAQTRAALDFALETGAAVLVARIFNPIGPGLPAHLALGEFARQIVALRSAPGVLRTGNHDVRRDFIDVRDVARTLRLLAEHPAARGVVNVCTGRGTALSELVAMLIRISDSEVAIEPDASRLRPGERAVMVGSTARLARFGAVPPETDFEAVVTELWREAEARWAAAA